jgi:hypothetical protein
MKGRIMQFTLGMVTGAMLGVLGVWLMVQLFQWGARVTVVEPSPYLAECPADVFAADRQAERYTGRQRELTRRRALFTGSRVEMNMEAIIQIESSDNPYAVSPQGCRGLCQISRATWEECTRLMGVNWTWDEDSWQPGENRAVGHFYMNRRIPKMLAVYGIDDNHATRIGAYNWGISNLRRAWNQYGHDWLSYAPQETQDYVIKYETIISHAR